MLISVCCALLAWGSAARAADDVASVRQCSERYTKGILKQDRAVLEGSLHKQYRAEALLARPYSRNAMDAKEVVAHWTNADNRFTTFETAIERVQLVGDTAIETGKASGTCGERKAESIFMDVRYTRVWVKDKTGWRLVYERY